MTDLTTLVDRVEAGLPTCATCKFAQQWDYEQKPYLMCFRRAPTVIFMSGADQGMSAYPAVLENWWCGEHEPREATNV